MYDNNWKMQANQCKNIYLTKSTFSNDNFSYLVISSLLLAILILIQEKKSFYLHII